MIRVGEETRGCRVLVGKVFLDLSISASTRRAGFYELRRAAGSPGSSLRAAKSRGPELPCGFSEFRAAKPLAWPRRGG